MYKLTRFSVKYPTTIMMVVLAVLLLGYISFTRLGVDLLPEMNNPRLFVEISAGERPPEEIEEQYVSQLEAVAARGPIPLIVGDTGLSVAHGHATVDAVRSGCLQIGICKDDDRVVGSF